MIKRYDLHRIAFKHHIRKNGRIKTFILHGGHCLGITDIPYLDNALRIFILKFYKKIRADMAFYRKAQMDLLTAGVLFLLKLVQKRIVFLHDAGSMLNKNFSLMRQPDGVLFGCPVDELYPKLFFHRYNLL